MKTGTWIAHLFFVIFWVSLAVTFTCTVGCKDNSEWPEVYPPVIIGNVLIHMDTDTLAYLSGDTVSASGFAVVTDQDGRVIPGRKVNFTLSEPFGLIEFTDPIRRDTTNALGRVEFNFRALAANPRAGHNTITATVVYHSSQWVIAVAPASDPQGTVSFALEADTLVLTGSSSPDSIRISLLARDRMNSPMANVSVGVSVSGGSRLFLPATNTVGMSSAWWHLPRTPGTFYVRAHGAVDSVVVVQR
jgi:hypothetical protein